MSVLNNSSLRNRVKNLAATVSLAAGVLAVTNMETIWLGYHQAEQKEANEMLTPSAGKKHKRVKLNIDSQSTNYKPLQSSLSQSLEGDELNDANPFAHLSTMAPLQQIMFKGVAKFKRETFRSPDYQDESGYDLVSYEVEHTDGSKSTILAYLEKTDVHTWRNVGAPDPRTLFVAFLVSNGERSSYSFFRGGDLIEQSELSVSEAQTLVSQRLSSSVPFLSVSR